MNGRFCHITFLKDIDVLNVQGGIKKDSKDFVNEVYNLVGDEYTVVGEYINDNTKIEIRHNTCGNLWKVLPHNFLNGHRCIKCYDYERKTHEEFVKEVNKKYNNEYTIIGEYKNSKTKLLIRHNLCKNSWETITNSFLRGARCPFCFGKIRKTQEQFNKEVYELVNDEYTVLSEYKNAHTKIKIRHNCDKCGNYEWYVKPVNFLNGHGCPVCKESKGEKQVRKFLLENNIKFVPQKTYDNLKGLKNGLLSYDFYLPKFNLLIEYQGEFHQRGQVINQTESQFQYQQEHDRRKREYAKQHNIKLLEIWYWDFDNIEKILNKELNTIILKEVV